LYPEQQNILVVEHHQATRKLIAGILSEEGFAVTSAAEGLAALRAVQKSHFDLIVAALDLPGALDGFTTVRRARMRLPRLRALFTAECAPERQCCNPDCEEFIAVPFQRRELLGCVFELLQRDALPGGADLVRRCRVG